MMSPTGVLVLIGVLLFVGVVGLVYRLRNGRITVVSSETEQPTATLLLFTTEVCSACRQVSNLLDELLPKTAGPEVKVIDVAEEPELAAKHRVLRAPTLLALNQAGQPIWRGSGALRRAELSAALAAITSSRK